MVIDRAYSVYHCYRSASERSKGKRSGRDLLAYTLLFLIQVSLCPGQHI